MKLVKKKSSKDFLSHIHPFLLLRDGPKIESVVHEQLHQSTNNLSLQKQVFQTHIQQQPSHSSSSGSNSPLLFHSLVLPLSINESDMITMGNSLRALSLLHPNAQVRKSASCANNKIEEHKLDLFCNIDNYQMLCHVRDTEWNSLNHLEQRLLCKMLQDCVRNGMQITDNDTKQSLIVQKKKQIAQLKIEFNKNLIEDKTCLVFDKRDLVGLSDELLNSLDKVTEEGSSDSSSERYRVTLKPSDVLPIRTNAELTHVRKAVEIALASKCQEINTPIAEQIIRLRTECAQLLGYQNHADYVLSNRMAQNTETVFDFLHSLREKVTDAARKEIGHLLALKKQHCTETKQEFDGKLNAWDLEFYKNLAMKNECNRDDSVIRQYFPLDQTLRRMFKLFGEMFGLSFKEITETHAKYLWHEDVRLFCVYDTSCVDSTDRKIMGYLFLDVFTRPGKYMTNACFNLQQHYIRQDGTRQLPAACIVLNYSICKNLKQRLLRHHELKSLLHEFGHFCHNVCSRSPYGRFSGTQVEKDFAEFPSQLLENWCWNAETLQLLSGHYKTGEVIPREVINSILETKNLYVSHQILARLHHSMYDMIVHSDPNVHSLPSNYTSELYSDLKKEICFIVAPEGTNASASFGHIMRTYDAGFYSYLWSQVFSCDAFKRFEDEGSLTGKSQTSTDYRSIILESGNTRDASDMIHQFLGREPSQSSFLSFYQLVVNKDPL